MMGVVIGPLLAAAGGEGGDPYAGVLGDSAPASLVVASTWRCEGEVADVTVQCALGATAEVGTCTASRASAAVQADPSGGAAHPNPDGDDPGVVAMLRNVSGLVFEALEENARSSTFGEHDAASALDGEQARVEPVHLLLPLAAQDEQQVTPIGDRREGRPSRGVQGDVAFFEVEVPFRDDEELSRLKTTCAVAVAQIAADTATVARPRTHVSQNLMLAGVRMTDFTDGVQEALRDVVVRTLSQKVAPGDVLLAGWRDSRFKADSLDVTVVTRGPDDPAWAKSVTDILASEVEKGAFAANLTTATKGGASSSLIDARDAAGVGVAEVRVVGKTETSRFMLIEGASERAVREAMNKLREVLQPLVCTGLSWNCKGYTLAVACGRFDVSGWCSTAGSLCVWNLGRKALQATKPDVRITLDSCLQCVAFHPTHPALVAGGTINGEVVVWDLSREGDMQRARSALTDLSHREPVTQLQWHFNASAASRHSSKEAAYQLLSVGSDGRVLVWNWQKMDKPLFAYELTWAVRGGAGRKNVWGGTCMAAASSDEVEGDRGAYIVGTDGGPVFKCLLHHNSHSMDEFAKAGGSARLVSPIKTEYQAHAGPVQGAHCAPSQPGIFATCGIDGTLRVSSQRVRRPLLSFEPSGSYLYSCQWSPCRPLVLAAGAGNGKLAVYDLQASALNPALSLDVAGDAPVVSPVHAVSFNPHLPEYLATACGARVRVWGLGPGLSEPRAGEPKLLEALAELEDGEEQEVVKLLKL